MFKINVTCDRCEEFGVVCVMRFDDEGYPIYGISRQLGNAAEFEMEGEAKEVVKTFTRNKACDHFGFDVV